MSKEEIQEELIFSDDARDRLKSGINKLAKAVSTTMGPKGRTVLIQRKYSNFLTKDGVTVAKNVKLQDNIENMGVSLIREVAQKTADEAGDGTTTATVLADEIYTQGLKHVKNGQNPVEIKRGMDKALIDILESITPKEVTTHEEIVDVATISANGDKDIGKMVAEAVKMVGVDGVITVEEAKGIKDELIVTTGMKFYNGYLSPYFSNTDKLTVEFINPRVLLWNDRINNLQSLLPVFELCKQDKSSLVIICNSFDESALNTLVVNKVRGNIDVVVVKSPGFGDVTEQLKDVQVLTNGHIQNPTQGIVFDKIQTDLGRASKVIVTREDCTIICDDIDETALNERVLSIRKQIEEQEIKQPLQQRLARLVGGVANIKVQAPSEIETKEKRDRFDDAIGATKAAQEEGIVIGGGHALLYASKNLIVPELIESETFGYNIVKNAIKKPFRQIIINAGLTPEVIESELSEKTGTGFNSSTEKHTNLMKDGIIDSYKVLRVALTNAVSVASTLLTTECIIPLEQK